MPKRLDLNSILIIGSGPIVIGQGAEFDYSGVQACLALKEEGYRVILINSNPATIMTDPQFADATYIEPITWQTVTKIIQQERPTALLATMGGQTALNCALELGQRQILDTYNVELLGANLTAIAQAESREKFKQLAKQLDLAVPQSMIANSLAEATIAGMTIGFPVIVRASYTLGGSGSGFAYNQTELLQICRKSLALSPTSEVLIEEALIGWKEFELEVVLDSADNCLVVCSIENIDPMGIHTGDSITIAPAQTLTDREYQQLRNAAVKILRGLGVKTGGANVQFAVNPQNGRWVVIEVNPRVSRSSALAAKATGFPIAKVAAKLAIGYTLAELPSAIKEGLLAAAFEPTMDYVAIKIPKFNFAKFPQIAPILTTKMQAVGEVMALAVNFSAALQQAIVALDEGSTGLESKSNCIDEISYQLTNPGPWRLWYIADAYRLGLSTKEIHAMTKIDPWFLTQIAGIVAIEATIASYSLTTITADALQNWKQSGVSDQRLAQLLCCGIAEIRQLRQTLGIYMTFHNIDGCAGEFPSKSAGFYSSYNNNCEVAPIKQPKVLVIGSGPNRIGQGIEFDYCCVQAIFALQKLGYYALMLNCNPETVSTDADIADRLYFMAITIENILAIVATEQPVGVMIQFGGQTALGVAAELASLGITILGTSVASIQQTEDRQLFRELLSTLSLPQIPSVIVNNLMELQPQAAKFGYPLILRPSYVLGGQAMAIIHNQAELQQYLQQLKPELIAFPILLERYLDHAIEIDVDAVVDRHGEVLIAGVMEHLEFAGIHSGDSVCVLPAHSLSVHIQEQLTKQVQLIANKLAVLGLLNLQFAIKDQQIYLLEANLRASRTMPFVAKATKQEICQIAVFCTMGASLTTLASKKNCKLEFFAVKYPIFSAIGVLETATYVLGPEMQSTGEVMGIADSLAEAYAKCTSAVQIKVNTLANVNISAGDKQAIVKFNDNGQYSIRKLQ